MFLKSCWCLKVDVSKTDILRMRKLPYFLRYLTLNDGSFSFRDSKETTRLVQTIILGLAFFCQVRNLSLINMMSLMAIFETKLTLSSMIFKVSRCGEVKKACQ